MTKLVHKKRIDWDEHMFTILISYKTVDAPPHSLKDSNVNPKVKTTERVGVQSLARNTLGVEGRARAPLWGLGRMTSRLIIHMDLHKPNNKLVNA